MERKVLVAYASTHGSMQEVAQAVTTTMRGGGLIVDLQPARNVRSLEGYSAVVLGAPLYIFHLHKDALRFLSKYREEFSSGVPVAIFAGGPFGKGDEDEWQEVRKQLDQELTKFPWLKPVAVEVVGGKFDPAKLHFPWNLIPALKQVPPNDLRDWAAIRAWASSLDALFQPVLI
ncbi:MAG: flavodoxin [Anaerolineaceae bacterium]|nr:flavodoxin [Anaerolineaceae bacterium]